MRVLRCARPRMGWAHLHIRDPAWLWASEGPAAPVCPPLEGHRRTETCLFGPERVVCVGLWPTRATRAKRALRESFDCCLPPVGRLARASVSTSYVFSEVG